MNRGFFVGISLANPEGVLEGTGKALRHVELRSPAQARRPAMPDLLAAARDERRAASGL